MSPRRRQVLGLAVLMLLAFGAGVITSALIAATRSHFGGWSGDFAAYFEASGRWLDAEALYAPDLVAAPIPSVAHGAYLYPPTLALGLVPFRALSFDVAALVWGGLQQSFLVAAVLIAARAGGARRLRPIDMVVLIGLPLLFWPLTWLIRDGNVGGLLALLAALTLHKGRSAGVALAAGIAIKVVAVMAVPAAILAGRRMAAGLLVGLLALATVSIVLAPGDSADYPRVLANLAAGDTDKPYNLALNQTFAIYLGASEATTGRVVSLVIVAVLGLTSVYAAWRAWHRTAMSAAMWASLLLPATLWVHYLVIALVPVAVAWPESPSFFRVLSFLAAISLLAVPLLGPGPEQVLVTVVVGWLAPSSLWVICRSEARAHASIRGSHRRQAVDLTLRSDEGTYGQG